MLFTVTGNFKYLHKSSVWFLDFLALINEVPSVLKPPKITALLHWAEPFFSKYFTGFNLDDPWIISGKFFLLFNLNFAPNLLNGSEILLKSLFDKLLSPINLIGFVEFINNPSISLPKVPELFALIVRLLLYS